MVMTHVMLLAPEGRVQQGWAQLHWAGAQRWKMRPGAGNQRPGSDPGGCWGAVGDLRNLAYPPGGSTGKDMKDG